MMTDVFRRLGVLLVLVSGSDGPKQISAEVSAEVSAEISADTEISVIRTEISVCKHYKEMSFYSKLLKIFVFQKSKKWNILSNYQY